MELTHEFTVPATREKTWSAFSDIASVAECFPGATVEEATADTFSGQVKVKLGPIQLTYKGSGDFIEKDESSGTMQISAKGKDRRGNGTAGAEVVASFADAGGGSTKVTVHTDLSITGKPAQFGRGVIEDVSNKLLDQFVACLAEKVGRPDEPAPAPGPGSGSGPGAGPLPGSVNGSDPSAGAAATPAGAADARAGSDVQDELAARRSAPAAGAPDGRRPDDALDLGATVLPVLLRTYGRQAGVALGVLLLLVWLVRRRRCR